MFDVRTELFCRGKFGCAISTWRKFVIGYSNSAVPSGLEVPVQWSREYHSSSWSKFCLLSNLRLTNIVLFRFSSLFPSRLAWFLIHQMCYLPRQETSLPITVNHCRSLNKLTSSSKKGNYIQINAKASSVAIPGCTPLFLYFLFFIYSNNDRFPVIHKSFSSEFIDFISRNEFIWFNYMHMYI